jgi:exosortase
MHPSHDNPARAAAGADGWTGRVLEGFQAVRAWCARSPAQAALLAGCFAVLVYFFGFYKVFTNGALTTARWAYEAWNAENDLQHGPLILPGALVVAWMHREAFARAKKRGSVMGLFVVLAGVLAFLVAVWTLQPRIAIMALPMLLWGSVLFLWGWEVARLAAFPAVLLLFMVPVGFLLAHTEPLQQLVASVVHQMTSLLSLGINRDGVKLFATNPAFQCEVAGGCSGIRSLMAMTLLSALYVHFTQKELWKKVLIFCFALPGAVIGNILRVFTIVLFARFIDPEIGTGVYHDVSGFLVTIPIAMWLMLRFGDLLNREWIAAPAPAATAPKKSATAAPAASASRAKPSPSPISYDY